MKMKSPVNVHCRNMTLEKEIFPAATDSRFIRAVSIRTGYDRDNKKKIQFDFLFIVLS